MLIFTCLALVWLVLMLHSAVAEYRYYQSVKLLEPDIWLKLGSPRLFKTPMVFISPKGTKLLQKATNKTVCQLAIKHRQAGGYFLSYVVLVLIVSIVYFKFA